MNKTINLFLLAFCLISYSGMAQMQHPQKVSSAQIFEKLKKANTLCSVLYVAAHPDDENTNFISYLSNDKHFNVRYLSLTRGDGGQNLIGTETSAMLGVLRTQELLAARRIDGGEQFFSRANDFGFSKNPTETLDFWEKDAILSDVVWAIRKFQPDVIVNRFAHTTDRPNHGHHTTSAILSNEAFDIANNPNKFPEQLKYVSTWQPKRLYWNQSWWWYGSQEAFDKMDKSNMVSIDIGTYFPILGKSNREIAAESRSQHRCQGMGTMPNRGESMEWFDYLKGEKATDNNLFSGINTTWSRVKGGAAIAKIMKQVEASFNFSDPSLSVPKLLEAYNLIKKLPDSYWKKTKLPEIEQIIKDCLGLYIEANADDYSTSIGETLTLNVEAINRSKQATILKAIRYEPTGKDSTLNLNLLPNKDFKFKTKIKVTDNVPFTNPYWLNESGSLGMYKVTDQTLIGLPETPRALKTVFVLEIGKQSFEFPIEINYKWEESARGEMYRPLEVSPPVFANLKEKVFVFSEDKPKNVQILIKSAKSNAKGTLRLTVPQGWKTQPESIDFNLKTKGEEQTIAFDLYPSATQSEGEIKAVATIDGKPYDKEVTFIRYDHIPTQTILRPATAKVTKLDLKREGRKIGYLVGAGDDIPASLHQIGYEVTNLSEKDINIATLSQFDAVILGIRAYNTVERIAFFQPTLLSYVENGGNLIIQYNTNFELNVKELAPYSFKLGRDRVTDEHAEMRFLLPNHPVLNEPNVITAKDFEGWVQERGLYFPSDWDKTKFEAILSCNDPKEKPLDGGLLIAKYGKGYYIHSSLAWFRQLPAGVPGAYRLFANMISLGKKPVEKP